ncbi:MAG: patatin-like phospholipase family protein [Candidatus Symbiothrix sp.]|jgi:NTE family protein|nr:patatin-like phospholipase family protein [Candidatus Symbiothrix sp.]
MLKRVIFLIPILFLSISFAFPQKVGLTLSGGGAKGAVHIGVIKALEENNIPIDYIAGTSVGAIVGSLYAMGYSPEEMLAFFLSDNFYYWQTGKVEENHLFYFRKKRDEPDFMKINVPFKDSLKINTILPNNIINPIQLNQAVIQIYAQASAQCRNDFDRLFVPFLCVASDIYNKKAVIFRNGDLGNAVRASMTFPFVFKPILKDTIPLFDGGIYDNFPIKPTKEAWHPDFIIGSSVNSNKKIKPTEHSLYEQMENMIIQRNSYELLPEEGILLNFKLEDVGLLDFNKSAILYEIGYRTAMEKMDSIKARIKQRVPMAEIEAKRIEYKASLPKLIFRNIYITGTSDAQKIYIENQIRRDNDKEFTFSDFKKTYFHLLTNSKIKEILPHAVYDPENQVFDLYLDIQMNDEITIAFGGNVSSLSANQIYLGLNYQSMTEIFSNFNLDLQLGNAYSGFVLEGKVEIPFVIPLDFSGFLAYNYRKYYESKKLFIDTDIATFIRQKEIFGKLGLGLPFQNRAKIDLLLGIGELEDQYYQATHNYRTANFDRSTYNLFNAGIYYTKNSLNAKQYPVEGHNHQLFAQYIYGKETFSTSEGSLIKSSNDQSYLQISVCYNNYHAISRKFSFGYILEGVLSSKNLWSNYTASVLQAPAFTPTPHSKLVFNEAFRANQYLAGGLIPIWKMNRTVHLRGDFDVFFPVYPIIRGELNTGSYGKSFTKPAYLGEISLVAQLPFMSISLFGNYYSYPKENWNFGLNIGYLIFGPKFIP